MAVQPGDRVGSYEILSTLGAGGMGVVYRARDTRLGRDVAIKTLPDDVAADPERLARFEREARALAALNHPNIATIYGFERAGTTHFLTMEVVEGATLAERIERGPIPVEQALPIFVQIAEGLEAAHAKGIIHRDLKPANIKIAAGGAGARADTVKILDFGLAKTLAPSEEAVLAAGASDAPTLTLGATVRGELLGTAAYMSPEQAVGEPADERADIWAFGVCLFEALTGRRPFRGANQSQVLASVLKDEPDFAALPPSTPMAARRLLRRCLEKKRERRLHSIADARLDIEEAMSTPAAETVAAVSSAPRRMPRSWIGITLAVALIASGGGLVAGRTLRSTPASPPARAARFILNPAPNAAVGLTSPLAVAISADGNTVAYLAATAKGSVLFVRRIDQLDAVAIPGVEPNAYAPFLSPDGRWVGYVHEGRAGLAMTLRKVAVDGGSSIELANGPINGASWTPNGDIVFGQRGPLGRVPSAGGEARYLTELQPGEIAHRYPEVLPGGRAILFAAFSGLGSDDATIEALTLATGERKVLVRGASQPRYTPSGHLVYAVGSTLRAVAFDPERLELRGEPVPVQENVRRGQVGAAQYAVSASGALVYIRSVSSENVLMWVDRDGREEPISAPPRAYVCPRLSPDGTRIAAATLGSEDPRSQLAADERDLWIWDLGRETEARLTNSPAAEGSPVWSADGRRIFHSSALTTGWEVVVRDADGSGDPVRIFQSSVFLAPQALTADSGGLLAVRGTDSRPPFDIVRLDAAGKADPEVLLDEEWSFATPELSPDGRYLAYASDESGTSEVFVRPFPSLGSGRWQVSSGGGTRPLWSRDGREIFFLDASNHLAAATVTRRDGGLAIGRPAVLFETGYYVGSGARTYDVSLDGTRFLMIKAASPDGSGQRIVYVQNWFDELRRVAPARPGW
jgi:serine/threonine-protein kinase